MERPVVVAQANGPQGPAAGPTKVISVAKPQGEQSITVHLDGSTKLDLSAIADENITLVRIGDRLIILFDNHSQVTVAPFYDDRGQPIVDLAVELGPGRDVSAAAFATLFPITDDPAVLPATGAPGAPSGGANFVSFTIDGLAPPGTPLGLLGPEEGNGNTGEATTGQTNLQIVPMSLTDAKIVGAADEGGFVTDTIGTVGNHQGAPVTASGVAGSLDALVNFGTGGPSGTPFRFVSTADANAWLAKLGLESHGEPIDVAAITGNTLVASTDPLLGQPHDVFSLTIHSDGSWVFTLLAPLDDATGQGINAATIDLSGLIQAFDVVGLSITLSNDFKIVVTDDVPVLSTATASGSVEEAAMVSGSPGDQFGGSTDPGHQHGLAVVSGSLVDLVAFGADGPATMSFQGPLEGPLDGVARPSLSFVLPDGFQFAAATGEHELGVSSHGAAVDYVTVTSGAGFQTLTAWTEGGAGHEVFTLQLFGDGIYIFTLINPLDHTGDNADTVTLDLSSLVKAVDFDGDAVTLSGDFTITIADDTPALTGKFTSGAVNEDGLSSASGDLFGDGNAHGDQVVVTTATLPGLVNFGADGPAFDQSGGNSGFRFAVSDGGTFDFGVTSHGQEVDFVTLSAVTDGPDGAEQTLTAWTNGGADHGGHAVFTLTLDGDGNYKFTLINPLDEAGSFTTLDLSRLIEAVDFDGDAVTLASGSFTMGVNDDAPVLTGSVVTGSVSEGALSFSTVAPGDRFGDGNDQHHDGVATVFGGSLSGLVSFGADGQALTPDGHAAGFRFAVTDGDTHDLHVTSHGQEVDTIAVTSGDGSQTLTAWTHGGPAGGGHEVFTLTLGADGDYTFTLINPLDDAGPDGDAVTLDLSSLIQAVDFDGDAVTLSGDFRITVADDVTTLSAAQPGSVDEGGLTSATDPNGTGGHPGAAAEASGSLGIHFGADGPAVATTTSDTFGIHTFGQLDNFNFRDGGNFHFGGLVGGAFSPAAGSGFIDGGIGGTVTITDAAGPFTLTSIDLGELGDSRTVTLIGLDALGDVLASATLTVDNTGIGLPATVFDAAGTAFAGLQLAQLEILPGDTGAQVDVGDITVTRSTPGPVVFTDQTTAANNITVTDASGHAVALADLTSHGEALHFALLNPSTLVAFTGTDMADPVFTVTLSASASNGAYDFVLDKPLDQALAGPDALNFTFSYTARDFDGDTASGTFTVTATDDVPSITAAASGSVSEAGLSSATDPFGTGSHAGAAGFGTEASGTLGVHFGADGPAILIDPTSETASVATDAALRQFLDHLQNLRDGNFASQLGNIEVVLSPVGNPAIIAVTPSVDGGIGTVLGSPITISDALGLFALDNLHLKAFAQGTGDQVEIDGFDALGNLIASATVTVGTGQFQEFDATGTAFDGVQIAKLVLTDQNPAGAVGLEDVTVKTGNPIHFTDQTTAASNITVTDAQGDTVALADLTSHGVALSFTLLNPATLVAFTTSAADPVFTVTLSSAATNGSYDFKLDQPLDQLPSDGGAPNLTFSYTAQDFDGDTASGAFTVNTVDDAPVLAAASATVFEAGLTSATDPHGTGTSAGLPADPTAASGTLGIHFGADGAATQGSTSETASVATDAALGQFLGHLQHLPDGNLASQLGNIEVVLSPVGNPAIIAVTPSVDGGIGTVLGSPITISDALGLFALDNLHLKAFDQGTGDQVEIDGFDALGNLIASATVTVGTGQFQEFDATGTAFDGVQIAKLVLTDQNPAGAVGLEDVTVKTGNPIHFTDQTTAASNIVTVTDGHGLAIAPTNLTSHGQPLEFKLLSPTELVAYTGDLTASDVVFTVTLSDAAPNGSYDFVLHQPLDQPPGTSGGLDFTFSYTAQDFDGSATSGTFTVNTVDDAPAFSGTSTGSVVEAGLVSASLGGTDQYGEGNAQNHGTFISATGSLANIVHFGADGPSDAAHAFTFVDQQTLNTWLLSQSLTSHSGQLSFQPVQFSGDVATLVATVGLTEVFTLALNQVTGDWTFTLINPIDAGGHATNLDFSSLVRVADFDGTATALPAGDFKVTIADDGPMLVQGVSSTGFVSDAALVQHDGSAGTDLYGSGTGAAFGASPTAFIQLNNLVTFGADGPKFGLDPAFHSFVPVGFQFVSQDVATFWVSNLGLTSHGDLVDRATFTTDANGFTVLIAGTDQGDQHDVFSLTLLPGGGLAFTLLNPIDQFAPDNQPFSDAGFSTTIDLSGLILAVDFDGTALTLSGDVSVTIGDDAPLSGTATGGSVDESGLTATTDLFGSGSHGGDPAAPIAVSGSLGIHFGGDGPAGPATAAVPPNETTYTFDNVTSGTTHIYGNIAVISDLSTIDHNTIRGSEVTIATTDGSTFGLGSIDVMLYGFTHSHVDNAVVITGYDAGGNVVASKEVFIDGIAQGPETIFIPGQTPFVSFSGLNGFFGLELSKLTIAPVDPADGEGFTFTGQQRDPLQVVVDNFVAQTGGAPATLGPVHFSDTSNAFNDVVSVTNAGGGTVTPTVHGMQLGYTLIDAHTLVAFAGGNSLPTSVDDQSVVFSVTLSDDTPGGGYDFVLRQPLDDGGGNLNFTFAVTGQDFDGDTTFSNFTVTVNDDAPFAHTVSATMDENASAIVTLVAGTDYGPGADGPAIGGGFVIDTAHATLTDPTNGHLVMPTAAQLTVNGNSITLDPGADFQALGAGETATLDVPYTVTDADGSTTTGHVTFVIDGVNQAPVVTSGPSFGSIVDGIGSTNLVVNGGFESGTAQWARGGTGMVGIEPHGHSGAADGTLISTGGPSSYTQSIQTVAGQSYMLSFFADALANGTLEVDWNGVSQASFALTAAAAGHYQSFFLPLIGNGNPENLSFVFTAPGGGTLELDDIALQPLLGPTAPPTQTTSGTLTFSDADVNDTHTVVGNPVAEGNGYLGSFSLGALTEGGGSGGVPWQFTVDRSAIQFLADGQRLAQFYDVTIGDNHGGSVTQRVEVDILGANDAPVISAADHAENGLFLAGGGGTDTASGAIHFADPDLADRPTGAASVAAISHTDAGGHALTLTQDEINAIEAAFTLSAPAGNTSSGEIDWSFNIADSALSFLSAGQTVKLTETVTVSDDLGSTDTSTVTVVAGAGGTLAGGAGNDIFWAGLGHEIFSGGGGDNTYAFSSLNIGTVQITDFNNTTHADQVQVSATGFGGGLVAGQDVTSVFGSDGTKNFASPNERFHFDTADNTLYYSAAGSGGTAIAIAQVEAGVAVHPHDIHVVA